MSRTYGERHEVLTAAIKSNFGDYLDLVPSSTGLHVAAYARRASVDDIDAIASRAFDLGVAIQSFPLEGEPRAGIMLGYGRSEEHTSESSHVEISYAVFCLKKKKK